MRLFNTISLEIGSLCNRKCWFCPVATNKRPNEFMSMGLINKVAHELRSIGYAGRVELYMYNEPFLDKRLLDIIRLFRSMVPKSCIMIATNADYVHQPDQFQELFNAGLNQLQVNVYSTVPRYRTLQAWLEQSTATPGNVYNYQSPKERVYSIEQKFDKLLTPDSPKIGRFELSNRSGQVPGLEQIQSPLPKPCTRPFRFMQLNWKGQVLICCNDYHARCICGDANESKLVHIWENSPVYTHYRKKLIHKDRSCLSLCDKCSFKGGSYPHLLNSTWEELL